MLGKLCVGSQRNLVNISEIGREDSPAALTGAAIEVC
jgi:hypothetical protein